MAVWLARSISSNRKAGFSLARLSPSSFLGLSQKRVGGVQPPIRPEVASSRFLFHVATIHLQLLLLWLGYEVPCKALHSASRYICLGRFQITAWLRQLFHLSDRPVRRTTLPPLLGFKIQRNALSLPRNCHLPKVLPPVMPSLLLLARPFLGLYGTLLYIAVHLQ